MRTLLSVFTKGTGTMYRKAVLLKTTESQYATALTDAYNHLTIHFRLSDVLKSQSTYL